jgi:hypothetical protein
LHIQYPLPDIPSTIHNPDFKIEMNLYIQEDGSVGKVIVIKSSGDNVWDLLAAESVLKWNYSQTHADHHNIKIWLNQVAIVEFRDPKYLVLTKIICPTLEEADSVYKSLKNGIDFEELTAIFDDDKNVGLVKIDIHLIPQNI